MSRKNTVQDFYGKFSKADPEDCWLWLGAPDGRGYGKFMLGGKRYSVHNLSLILDRGRDPERPYACHHCDVPLCVNPSHLYWGTAADNVGDMISRGRFKDNKGTSNGRCKLDEEQVKEIRALHETGPCSHEDIAIRFGVTQSTVSKIVNRKSWRHV